MTEPSEITKKVNDKELDESELHKRMDADFDLWNLKKTVYDNHKTSINITSNDPRTFSDDVQSKLSRAERQIRIIMAETEGDDKREDIDGESRRYDYCQTGQEDPLHFFLQHEPPLIAFSSGGMLNIRKQSNFQSLFKE